MVLRIIKQFVIASKNVIETDETQIEILFYILHSVLYILLYILFYFIYSVHLYIYFVLYLFIVQIFVPSNVLQLRTRMKIPANSVS